MPDKASERHQDVHDLTVAQLSERCHADQSARKANSEWCRRLFSLALAEQNQGAWEAICDEFYCMVEGWVKGYSRFHQTGEEALFFVNEAFARLWQYASPLAQDGKFQKLSDYLQYLKRCVWTAIEDYLRKLERDALWRQAFLDVTNLDGESPPLFKPTERSLIIDQVLEILQDITQGDEQERLVAEETWVYGLPPREIQTNHPHYFATASEVSQIKRNILRRLQRHPKLKNWLDE